MDKYVTIGEAAEFLGKSKSTLRRWHEQGILVPDDFTSGGQRKYSGEQLRSFLEDLPDDQPQGVYEIRIDGFSSGLSDEKPVKRENALDMGKKDSTTASVAISTPRDEQSVVQKTFSERQELLKASSQITDLANDMNFGIDGVVEHPFNMNALLKLNEMSVVRRACINAISTNTARLGYRIKKTDPGAEEQDTDEVSEQIIDLLEEWAEQDDSSFADLIYKVKFDEESCGNGYIEVTRDRLGRVSGLHYVPAQTIWIKRDRSGFIQRVGVNKVGFYNFGDKYTVDATGNHVLRQDRKKDIKELIHFKLHASGSTFYGLPRDIAAITTIYGDELARNHNTKFFTHAATPELLLVFEVDKAAIPARTGTQPVRVTIPDEIKKQMEDHFRRTLSSSVFKPGIFHLPPGVTLKVERLSAEQKDAGWINFRKENRNEIQIAFQTPGCIVANTADGSSYATALAEKSVYLEQVIAPEQRTYQSRLMAKLWPELVKVEAPLIPLEIDEKGDSSVPKRVNIQPKKGSGVNRHIWKLEFDRMTIADAITLAQMHNIYGTLQVITKNEIRADLGKKPMAGGDAPPVMQKGGEAALVAENKAASQSAHGTLPPNAFVAGHELKHATDLRGVSTGGRGPNGTSRITGPRRVGEVGVPVPANFGEVGQAIGKSEEFDPETFNPDNFVLMAHDARDAMIDEIEELREKLEKFEQADNSEDQE